MNELETLKEELQALEEKVSHYEEPKTDETSGFGRTGAVDSGSDPNATDEPKVGGSDAYELQKDTKTTPEPNVGSGYDRGDVSLPTEDPKVNRPVYDNEQNAVQVTGETPEVDPQDEFDFWISLYPLKPCLPSHMAQIMLALMRVGFMDLDVYFDTIEELNQDEGDPGNRELGKRRRWEYAGHGCRRCRGSRRRGGRELQQDFDLTEMLESGAIAWRMDEALDIAIVDTFALHEDPMNCLVGMNSSSIEFDISFG